MLLEGLVFASQYCFRGEYSYCMCVLFEVLVFEMESERVGLIWRRKFVDPCDRGWLFA